MCPQLDVPAREVESVHIVVPPDSPAVEVVHDHAVEPNVRHAGSNVEPVEASHIGDTRAIDLDTREAHVLVRNGEDAQVAARGCDRRDATSGARRSVVALKGPDLADRERRIEVDVRARAGGVAVDGRRVVDGAVVVAGPVELKAVRDEVRGAQVVGVRAPQLGIGDQVEGPVDFEAGAGAEVDVRVTRRAATRPRVLDPKLRGRDAARDVVPPRRSSDPDLVAHADVVGGGPCRASSRPRSRSPCCPVP